MRVTECATTNGTYTAITGLMPAVATGTADFRRLPMRVRRFKFYLPITALASGIFNCEITTGATTTA